MGRKQLHITVILFFSLFFVACKSTRIIRENTWEFLKQNNESVHYYDFDEKLKGNGVIILGQNETLEGEGKWLAHKGGTVTFFTK